MTALDGVNLLRVIKGAAEAARVKRGGMKKAMALGL